MTREELETLLADARRIWPGQKFPDALNDDWRAELHHFRYAECLIAMGLLRQWHRSISPRQIRERVHIIRRVAARPEYQPGGAAWRQAMAARNGVEYTGGPADWGAWKDWAAKKREAAGG